MQFIDLPWRKAAYAGLLGAILFLTILPYFGWAWHRVLPEHTHLFLGAPHDDSADELMPAASAFANEPDLCANCTGTQIGSGVLHLPDGAIAQILSLAVSITALFSIRMPPEFSARVIPVSLFYQSPLLCLLDPPPTLA